MQPFQNGIQRAVLILIDGVCGEGARPKVGLEARQQPSMGLLQRIELVPGFHRPNRRIQAIFQNQTPNRSIFEEAFSTSIFRRSKMRMHAGRLMN